MRRLDLAAVDDLVAEPEEDVLDLAADLRDQVQVAARARLARQRDVDDLLGQPAVELGALELGPALGDRAARAASRSALSDAAGLAVADLAQRLLQLALPAEEADAGARRARPAVEAPAIALRASLSSGLRTSIGASVSSAL